MWNVQRLHQMIRWLWLKMLLFDMLRKSIEIIIIMKTGEIYKWSWKIFRNCLMKRMKSSYVIKEYNAICFQKKLMLILDFVMSNCSWRMSKSMLAYGYSVIISAFNWFNSWFQMALIWHYVVLCSCLENFH